METIKPYLCAKIHFTMKRTITLIIFTTMSIFGYSQDWFGFSTYQADNERIIKSGAPPEVVFMGNSITELWAIYHPDFFSSNNFCGRGISGQTSAQMLVRFTSDVIDLHPKAVVIMAGTNDVAHNDYWVSPERVVENVIAMCNIAKANGIIPIISFIPPCKSFVWRPEIKNAGQTIVNINKSLKAYAEANDLIYVDYHSALTDEDLGFPKTLSEDGCHPDPDTYFIMEGLVLEGIREALK